MDLNTQVARKSARSEDRKRLLKQLLRERGLVSEAIPRADRGADLPLSFAQQRLWFLERLNPGQSVYNIPLLLRLQGPVDEAALQSSLNEVIRRHEALRTRFEERNGEPRQCIEKALTIALDKIDVRSGAPDERFARARVIAERLALEPFDLARAPLLRAVLIRFEDDEAILGLIMHHMIGDGWSIGVLLRELAVLYPAHADGRKAQLPALALQYADFACWQRGWLKDAVLGEQLRYWKQHLPTPLPVLELPTDFARPPRPSYRGARAALDLKPERVDALRALARSESCTR